MQKSLNPKFLESKNIIFYFLKVSRKTHSLIPPRLVNFVLASTCKTLIPMHRYCLHGISPRRTSQWRVSLVELMWTPEISWHRMSQWACWLHRASLVPTSWNFCGVWLIAVCKLSRRGRKEILEGQTRRVTKSYQMYSGNFSEPECHILFQSLMKALLGSCLP